MVLTCFHPIVKALQERFAESRVRIGPNEAAFLAERNGLYMVATGVSGWRYVQYCGGPKGFVKVIDDRTIAFADLRGNHPFIGGSDLASDDRVALIVMDCARRARLKIVGHVRLLERLHEPGRKDAVERTYVVQIEAFDWSC